MLVRAFISSHLDCCDALFSCLTKVFIKHVQSVQNAAVTSLTSLENYPTFDIFELASCYEL